MGLKPDVIDREFYRIGDGNPLLGEKVRVTWLKRWGRKDPGFTVEGTLEKTFVVAGRVLVGNIRTESGEHVSAPWSINFLRIEAI
jgi:hypothetical protein